MADCSNCGTLLPNYISCETCGQMTVVDPEHLATMFATMTSDLGQLLERRLQQLMVPRLEKMKIEILKALNERQGAQQ